MDIKYTVPEITADSLEYYAFTNYKEIKGDIKAIVLDFHGLGQGWMKHECNELELRCASEGILTIFPYYGPWSWMNAIAVKYVDKVIETACERHSLDVTKIPIISTGGSMGGHSALIYSAYAKYTPKACVTNCPVCDFVYHATEREDLPRTVYLAFQDCGMSLEDALYTHSSYHLAPKMPDIPYHVFHGDKDDAVNKQMHSDRFVARMKEFGKDVTYVEIEGMGHCDLGSFPEYKELYYSTIISLALK